MRLITGKYIFLVAIFFLFYEFTWRFVKIWDWWRQPVLQWAKLDSCPLCYGTDACRELIERDVDLACQGGFASFLAFIGDKNVLFGCSQIYGDIVIKKLGHDWQLMELDKRVCSVFGSGDECNYDSKLDIYSYLNEKIQEIISLHHENIIESDELGMLMCPNTTNFHKMISSFFKEENYTSLLNRVTMLNLWTIMNINPEPIIMKYINENNKHWPIPKYLGACGRMTVQEYAGKTLNNYLEESFEIKSKIAINLLNAADLFTFNDTNFRFYLTDVSVDNIVISSIETLETIFVDLENVIILDKNIEYNDSSDWTFNHTSTAFECIGCFIFSSEKICSHHLSDHNYYSICKLIKEDLFGAELSEISSEANELLEECVNHTGEHDRFSLANLLREKFKLLISELS